MPDLIPNQNLGAMFGSSVGSGLGGGLGAGLQALAEHKLEQMSKRKELDQGAKFWKSLGLDDETAYAFASSPKELQKSLLDRLEGASIGQQGQQQPSQMGQQLMQQPNQNDLSHLAAQPEELGQFGQSIQQQMQQQGQPNQMQMLQMLGMLPQEQGVNPFMQQPQQMQKQQPSQNQLAQLQQMVQQVPQQQQQQPGKVTLGANPVERRHREALDQQKELAQFKETKALRHEIIQKSKAAKQDLKDLDRLEELQDSGKLDTPGYTEFLSKAGLDIQALKSPESEEFQKIQANFLRNAKQYFGGRISNFEVESFLKTIPSLSNSNQGRQRVIANLKNIARGAVEYNNALKEVLAENKGVPPLDLEERIDDKVDKRLDQVSKQFKKDLAKPVPKEQPRLVTALQAGAGKLVGNLGKGLAGAGLGALAGSRVGPAGIIPGGIAGGIAGLSGVGLKDFM